MLAMASTGASGRNPVDLSTLVASGDYVLDTKLDGIRAIRVGDRFWNRQGVEITHKFPELKAVAPAGFPTSVWDGEIVAANGKFETVARRDKLEQKARIRQAAESDPCRFVTFDYVGHGANVPSTDPWSERRLTIEYFQAEGGMPITPIGYDLDFVEALRGMGMEGVIAKRITSRYHPGRRSKDWIKFKFLHRVSCLVSGYEPGTGSREHFGAMFLALIDETGRVVPCGKVGTGFTMRESWQLKAALDASELLVIEVECLNVTSGGTLRFPVYKGIRTDVAPTACTIDQLESIPRSSKEAS